MSIVEFHHFNLVTHCDLGRCTVGNGIIGKLKD